MKKSTAVKRVELAIKAGKLTRPDECEICKRKPKGNGKVPPIVAHHWNGYNNPLDIWWICRSCNRFLLVHDGSMNRKQARDYITMKKLERLLHYGYRF